MVAWHNDAFSSSTSESLDSDCSQLVFSDKSDIAGLPGKPWELMDAVHLGASEASNLSNPEQLVPLAGAPVPVEAELHPSHLLSPDRLHGLSMTLS